MRLWFCFLRAAKLSLFCLSALLGVLTLAVRIIFDFLSLTELRCAVGLKKKYPIKPPFVYNAVCWHALTRTLNPLCLQRPPLCSEDLHNVLQNRLQGTYVQLLRFQKCCDDAL